LVLVEGTAAAEEVALQQLLVSKVVEANGEEDAVPLCKPNESIEWSVAATAAASSGGLV